MSFPRKSEELYEDLQALCRKHNVEISVDMASTSSRRFGTPVVVLKSRETNRVVYGFENLGSGWSTSPMWDEEA